MSKKKCNFAANSLLFETMKLKFPLLLLFFALANLAQAGITTYTFTSFSWASKVGATVCDGTTDGWVSNQDGNSYNAGRVYADGSLNSAGVGVTTSATGAGATSVKSFTNVRRVTFNICQNSSKGRGVIYCQIGSNPYDSIVVNKPAYSGAGTLNRDSMLVLDTPQSGNIRFWINCSENAIYLNSIEIRAEEGGSTPFTQVTYQLVTDVDQLQDSDQIIIGVPSANVVMGYFDESVSQNNIHSLPGRFVEGGSVVSEDERAIYTLRRAMLDDTPCFLLIDEIRYYEAYLVASGGQTKNRLALWDNPQSSVYGDYGCWDISIAADGDATIMSMGTSLGKYLQYNASNSPTLFGCYALQGSQTPVKIYRRVEAIGDVPGIVAPLVNFGNLLLHNGAATATQTIMVNANRLSEDISIAIDNPAFTVQNTTIDREGDRLAITFTAHAPGHYAATMTLTSDTVRTEVPLMANVVATMTVAEAVQSTDYATIYLGEVEVTKKYDQYVFVRDATGSMLLYDNGDGTGSRFAQGVQSGDKLTGVTGRFKNYYGVPEINLTAAFTKTGTGVAAQPETLKSALDSADVCRLVKLDSVTLTMQNEVVWQGETIPVKNAFNVAPSPLILENLTAVVMISWDEVQLWLVSEEPILQPQGVGQTEEKTTAKKMLRDGILLIRSEQGDYTLLGSLIH